MKRALLISAALVCAAPARLLAQQSPEERFRSLPPEKQEELRQKFRELQSLPPEERAELRKNLERLEAMPPAEREAVEQNYRRFQQTYHVALQLESVALKGKPLPRVAALVEAAGCMEALSFRGELRQFRYASRVV